MIIEKLVLHNYGVYEGKHELDLQPKKGRPITLIGALNGAGKTTLLESIQICLFGRSSAFIPPAKSAYVAYLSEAINRRRRSESSSVSVTFRVGDRKEGVKYEATRTWGLASKGVNETLQISVNGVFDPDVTDRWAEISERFLPSKLSDLFFFDGERIEALAEPVRCSQMIREGLSNLLGLDLISDLSKTLIVLDRRMRSEDLSHESHEKLQALESQRELLSQQRDALLSEKSNILEAIEETRKQLSSVRRELEAQGGDLLFRRDEVRTQRERLGAKIKDLRNNLIEHAEGVLPLAMLGSQLDELSRLASVSVTPARAAQLTEALAAATHHLVRELEKQNYLKSEDIKSAEALADLVVESEMSTKQQTEIDCDFYEIESVRSNLVTARSSSLKLLVQLDAHLTETDRLDALLAAVPEGEKVEETVNTLKQLEQLEAEQATALVAFDQQFSRIQKDFDEIDSKIEKILAEQRQYEADQTLTKQMHVQLARAKENLALFQDRMRARHISRLEQLILEGLKHLYRKRNFVSAVKIDPTDYSIELVLEGEGTVPAFKLSAAERQLLAVSVLWGLAKASGRELPTIIDTPLGRLDSKHRTTFVERYFPNAAKQVILLSTDEEIIGSYYNMLKPHIANEYVIYYDEDSQSSSIRTGYFNSSLEAA